MSEFEKQISQLPSTDEVVIMRMYDQSNTLISIVPNLNGLQGVVQVLSHIADSNGVISFQSVQESLPLWGEHVEDAKTNPQKHPNLSKLLALTTGTAVTIQKVMTKTSHLLEKMTQRQGTRMECDEFVELLNQGAIRAAEKVNGVWEPQTYVIDGILNYFGSHPNEILSVEGYPSDEGYQSTYKCWDKVALKTANFTEEDFEKGGVRYAPGSIVRTGAYIGPQTVIMNQAFVNIGAYIAGGGVMIDGAARVASCAQIGKGVKFGAGSGVEGVLEPAGRLPCIVEDHVKIGAMCEVSGMVREGAVLASGVIMASGKKIYDEATGEVIPPLEWKVGEQTFLLPEIPAYRLAVGGSVLSENGKFATDSIILKPGDLRERDTLKHFAKQGILYN